jgi:hypothetical protein
MNTNVRSHVSVMTEKSADATAVRPFHVDIPEEALEDLRRRIVATQWPEQETVPDRGGHFAAWEEPQLFTDEVRACFRPLRT